MKAELWLNRADHELVLAQELLTAGSFLWAASYAHRALEYTLEGLIVMKTGVRPERGSTLSELHHATRQYLPDTLNQPINALSEIAPFVWQSDISAEQIIFLTEKRVSELIEGGKTVLSWVGDEWAKELATDPSPGAEDPGNSTE
ncbi:MAG TPA: HEPN domain-containing protein [Methanospirillum sp.]|uniref:HEPN domain-containing protein n=1 Tax=Methanospirillum sp. TaxID=45200 RepID=UPI002B9C73F7|nr:HEPN domain-containing protein [Methanospirillum sp.]HWQ64011.1 HEPN domain-containing protein [Methanospirillum sp.]